MDQLWRMENNEKRAVAAALQSSKQDQNGLQNNVDRSPIKDDTLKNTKWKTKKKGTGKS